MDVEAEPLPTASSNFGKHTYHFPEALQTATLKAGSELSCEWFSTHFSFLCGLMVAVFGVTPELHIFPVRTTVPELFFVCTEPIPRFWARTDELVMPAKRTFSTPRSRGRTKLDARSNWLAKTAVVYSTATGPGSVTVVSAAEPGAPGVPVLPVLHPVAARRSAVMRGAAPHAPVRRGRGERDVPESGLMRQEVHPKPVEVRWCTRFEHPPALLSLQVWWASPLR